MEKIILKNTTQEVVKMELEDCRSVMLSYPSGLQITQEGTNVCIYVKERYNANKIYKALVTIGAIKEEEPKYKIYTDGSYNPKNNIGSWAYVILKDEKVIKEEAGRVKEKFLPSRNIGGECTAVLRALLYCSKNNIKGEVEIIHDLEGVQKWTQGQWKTNTDITKVYVEWFHKLTKDIKISFVQVKSHSNNKWNEYVDRLAGKITMGVK